MRSLSILTLAISATLVSSSYPSLQDVLDVPSQYKPLSTSTNHTCHSRHGITPLKHEQMCSAQLAPKTKPTKKTIQRTEPAQYKTSSWPVENDCVEVESTDEDEDGMYETTKFCSYTDPSFSRGRGMTIITTPEIAERLYKNSSAFTKPVPDDVNVEVNPPYYLKSIPGRGVGVIVNKTLNRGDVIFKYTPVFVLHAEIFDLMDYKARIELQQKSVESLPPASRDSFLALHGHFGGDEIEDRINTNAFQIELGDGDEEDDEEEEEEEDMHYIILPETARMNHDCRPSAVYFFDTDTLTHYVHATRTIHVGEELSISYTDPTVIRATRQSKIKESWGFECSCSACTQHNMLTRESDRRLEIMTVLEEQLGDWTAESKGTPEMAETLISLYLQERLQAYMANSYTLAALAYNAVCDRDTAAKYALLAVEHEFIENGQRDSDVQEMIKLLDGMEEHWSWGRRLKR